MKDMEFTREVTYLKRRSLIGLNVPNNVKENKSCYPKEIKNGQLRDRVWAKQTAEQKDG
jgi:hypothetical protein